MASFRLRTSLRTSRHAGRFRILCALRGGPYGVEAMNVRVERTLARCGLNPAGRFYDFGHDLFPQLLAEGVPMYGYPTEQYLLDIGSYEKYNQAQRDLAEGRVV